MISPEVTLKSWHKSCFLSLSFLLLLAAGVWDSGVDRFGSPTDEWAYNISTKLISRWTTELLSDPEKAMSDSILDKVWKYAPLVVVHPPLSRELSAISFQVGRMLGMDGWRSFRLSNAIVYALLGIGLASLLWRHHPFGSLVVILGMILNIRMHGHIRTAQTDIVLTALWFAVGWTWVAACASRIRPWIPGLVLGLALATKSTAVLLLPALPIVGLVFWRRASFRPSMFLLLCIPVAMIFAPIAWAHPVDYWVDWLRKLTDRSSSALIPVGCLGRTWVYHAPAWVALFHWMVVIPEVLLVGFLTETTLQLVALRKHYWEIGDNAKLYLAMVAISFVPMASQVLQSAPSHDLERLFLPALPVTVLGTGFLATRILGMKRGWIRNSGLGALGLGAVIAFRSLWMIWPFPLSYFNGFIGGTRGAENLGMNSYYFKTEFGTHVLDSVVGQIPDSSSIGGHFIVGDLWMWSTYSERVGRGIEVRVIAPDRQDTGFQDIDYWLIYNRRDHILALDRIVQESWRPIWGLSGPEGVGMFALYSNPSKFKGR